MCGQHSAVLPTPIQKTALSACFRFLNFSSIFPGGQQTPFAPMCGRPCLVVHLMSSKGIKFIIDTLNVLSVWHATRFLHTAMV